MVELLNMFTSERYNDEINEIVDRTKMSFLDAIMYHADENGLESETVAGLINVKTKNRNNLSSNSTSFAYYNFNKTI